MCVYSNVSHLGNINIDGFDWLPYWMYNLSTPLVTASSMLGHHARIDQHRNPTVGFLFGCLGWRVLLKIVKV